MDRPKSINRDNSRRFYASDIEYPEHMRRTSDKAKDIKYKEKHSEFKKPWWPDMDFSEMEYWLDPPPGIDPIIYKPPYVDIPDPRDEPPPGDLAVLYCTLTGCYNDKAKTCLLVNCSYPIVGAALAGSYPGFFVAAEGGLICVTAPKDASPAIEINIAMKGKSPDGRVVTGTHDSILIEICDNCEAPAAFDWDSSSSPSTIARSASVSVYVDGGVSPYSWSVSGTGASLDNGSTAGLVNTLNASGSACGLFTITVTDACGQEATGEIKCTTGSWQSCPYPSDGATREVWDVEHALPNYNYFGGLRIVFAGMLESTWRTPICTDFFCTGYGLSVNICAIDYTPYNPGVRVYWVRNLNVTPATCGAVQHWDC